MDLDEVFRAHQKEVFVYFMRVLSDTHRAEDLAQETFARAFDSIGRFRGDSSFRTWLFAIARGVLSDHFRKRKREVFVDPPERESSPRDPNERLGIEETLAALPVTFREAVVLVDVLGFTPAESAQSLGVDVNTFRVRLHRARARFRELHRDG